MIATEKDSLVLDFFSGSATTADAIFQLNEEDNGKRKFIMVQIPEMCQENYESEFNNICEMAKERIRRAGMKVISENPESSIDTGFRVFRLENTNIKWNEVENTSQLNITQIETTPDLSDFILGTKDIDVVYEMILRQKDVSLSEVIELLYYIGERTYLYASSYLVCLESQITKELIDKLSELNPLPIKFIFRDSAFGDNIALKDETFRRLKALIEKNAGSSKITYTVEFI